MSQTPDVASCGPLEVILPPVTPLNVPRRQTLCTTTVREEPTFNAAAYSRVASASWATRPPLISIDVSSETRRKIRPLPIPPSPKSAPPMPRRQISYTSLRPLPCVPESAGVSVSVTPASPVSPPTRIVPSNDHLSPPSTFPPPRRFASLSLRLNTSPDALEPRAADPPPSSPPPTPSIPEPPSPDTARQKRRSKLLRHFGESVELALELRAVDPSPSSPPPAPSEPPSPDTARQKRRSKLLRHLGESVELALELRAADPPPSSPPPTPSIPEPPSPGTARQKRRSKLLRHLGESVELELLLDTRDKDNVFVGKRGSTDIYSQTVIAVKRLLDLDDADDSDISSEDGFEDDEYSLVFTHERAHCAIPVKRYSRKWIREKGGERFVEENYSDILRDLRAL